MSTWPRHPVISEIIEISMQNQVLLQDFRRALPDFAAEDNVGSPYFVRRYALMITSAGRRDFAAARGMR
jgi:hypothetical protein